MANVCNNGEMRAMAKIQWHEMKSGAAINGIQYAASGKACQRILCRAIVTMAINVAKS